MKKLIILMALIGLSTPVLLTGAQGPDLPQNRELITAENVDQLEQVFMVEDPLETYHYIDWDSTGRWMVVTGVSREHENYWSTVIYDLDRQASFLALLDPTYMDTRAYFAPGKPLLGLTGTGEISLLDLRDGSVSQVITGDVKYGPFEWSRDGRMIMAIPNLEARAFEGADGNVADVFEANSGEHMGTVGYPYSGASIWGDMKFHFTPDGMALITIFELRCHLWEINRLDEYRDPLLMSKTEFISQLGTIRYTPEDAIRYTYTVFKNDAGQFALWLEDANGSTLFSTQTEEVLTVMPNESGDAPFNEAGVPAALEGYSQLPKSEMVKALSELQQLTFDTLGSPVQLLDMKQAAAVAQRWYYDPEADTMLDRQTGILYMTVEDDKVGRFIDDEGILANDTQYYVGNRPAPDELSRFAGASQLIFSPDGQSVVVVHPTPGDGPYVRLLDFETGADLVVLEGIPENVFDDTTERFFSFHPSGQLLAAHINGVVFIWDTQTGQLSKTIEGVEPGSGVSFSADGTLIVVGYTRLRFYAVP
ncbi:MAG: hypothetical protein HY866_14615 [Chloroflexi bacterium]|nr:hypothetical protein [Chloroflexota bacterium]